VNGSHLNERKRNDAFRCWQGNGEDSRSVEVVGHDVYKVQGLCHGGHVVGLVNGFPPCRHRSGQEETVLVKLGTQFAKELGVVFPILG